MRAFERRFARLDTIDFGTILVLLVHEITGFGWRIRPTPQAVVGTQIAQAVPSYVRASGLANGRTPLHPRLTGVFP